MNQGQPCVDQTVTPVQVQSNRLVALIRELQNALDKVIGRLEPVRNIVPLCSEQNEKCHPTSPESSHVQFLREQCSQLEGAILKIVSLEEDGKLSTRQR